jgi:hypothetical protein
VLRRKARLGAVHRHLGKALTRQHGDPIGKAMRVSAAPVIQKAFTRPRNLNETVRPFFLRMNSAQLMNSYPGAAHDRRSGANSGSDWLQVAFHLFGFTPSRAACALITRFGRFVTTLFP